MAAQDNDTLRLPSQLTELFEALHLKLELIAGIGGKAVDDDLSESVMVQIGVAECLPWRESVLAAEIVPNGEACLMVDQHIDWGDE